MSHINRRLARLQYITDPATGRVYPIPAGGNGAGEGDGSGDGGSEGEGSSGDGEGGEGGDGTDGSGGEGGDPSPLEQQALDAIEALKQAGADIPDALNAAVKEFRDARQEAGRHRTEKAAEKARADAAEQRLGEVMKLLGVDDDGGDPDPEQLQAAIGEKDKALTAKTVELDAYRTASRVKVDNIAPDGVNPDALLDSASFLAAAAELDPTSESYTTDLESAITKAVENNPLLAASPGGGPRRGPGQGPRPTPNTAPASLEDAFANHYQ